MDGRTIAAGIAGLIGVVALGAVFVLVLTPAPVTIVPSAETPLLIARNETPQPNVVAAAPIDSLGIPSTYRRPVASPPGRVPPPSKGGHPPPALVAAPPPEAPKIAPETQQASLPPDPQPVSPAPVAPPPAPVAPPKVAHPVDHRYDGALTMAEIAKMKSALRLSRDQEAYWPPVANLLRELGRTQMAQIDAGKKLDYTMSSDMMQRFYSAASPLLGILREDQKNEVRRRAKMMGLEAYASYI